MKVGDKINIKAEYPDIAKRFEEQCEEAETLMETGSSMLNEAKKSFWDSVHELYPALDNHAATYNKRTGTVIVLKKYDE